MKHSPFVHLHLHTHYSLLDGAIRPEALFQKASQYKMPALAITDHGNMFGAIEFYEKCKNAGIKPIIGAEVYVAPGSRFVKETGNGHREAGSTVLDIFTEWKSVYIDYSGKLQRAQIDNN